MVKVSRRSWKPAPLGDLNPLLPEEEGEELMPLQVLSGAAKEFIGFKKVEVLVDSGAAASVMPERYVEDHEIVKGEAARKGVHYVAADGARIPNLGEVKVRLLTKEKEKPTVTFQVADVHKPILSVAALTAQGHKVNFQRDGGAIILFRSGREIAFQKREGVYKLELLMAPGRKGTLKGGRPTGPTPAGGQPTGSTSGGKNQAAGFARPGF